MEVTIAFWWIIQLSVTALTLFVMYLAIVKNRFRSRFYNTITIILVLISLFNPIKINETNSASVSNVQNVTIEKSKVLPKKVSDDSFKENSLNATKDITDKEIWK